MTTLLVIRHGQSVSNIRGVFTGNLDLPLTQQGQRQAEITAEYILNNHTVDAVYSSDLCRAMDTANAVARQLQLPLFTDKGLREIYAGEWEGKSFDELTERYPSYGVWRTDIGNCVPEGGESVAQLSTRVIDAFTGIANRHDGKTVVVATHATPIRALQCHCEGKPASEMKNIAWVTNASVTTVVYDNGHFHLTEVCHDAHLGSITSRFPSNV